MGCEYHLLSPSSLFLPEGGSLRRIEARPTELQDPTYSEKYDYFTLFYDAFRIGDEVVFISPPLLNLEAEILDGRVQVGDDPDNTVAFRTRALERAQMSTITLPKGSPEDVELHFFLASGVHLKLRPHTAELNLFKGKRTLLTLQKNESIEWILDWVRYYQIIHGINAVLLYDNASTDYSSAELLAALRTISGLDVVCVVNWRFIYGPQGSPWAGPNVPWDSDFCQIGALQDACFHYLAQSEGVINADVDELVIPLTDDTLFDALKTAPTGTIGYSGRWIENAADLSFTPGELPHFWHFFRIQGNGRTCRNKWTACPPRWSGQQHTTAHFVRGPKYDQDPRFYIAHFRGLNSGWKIPDRATVQTHTEDLNYDLGVIAALMRVFPDKISSKTVHDALRSHAFSPALDPDAVFQDWLQEAITARTAHQINWHASWVWRGKVLVFETSSSLGRVAFDVSISSQHISLALSVRELSYFDDLTQILAASTFASLSLLRGRKGYRIKTYERNGLKRDVLVQSIAKDVLYAFSLL